MKEQNEYIDYQEELEVWLRDEKSEYSKISHYLVGISFYHMNLDTNFFGHEFDIITSKPKNFRIDTITTSCDDLNSIKLYLSLAEMINTQSKKFTKNISLDNFVENTFKIFHNKGQNEDYCLYMKQNDEYFALSIKKQKEDIGIKGVDKVISILYIGKETNNSRKSLLISISTKDTLQEYDIKTLMKYIYNFFIAKESLFYEIKDKFLNIQNKSITKEFTFMSHMKTSIVLFTDITNSTNLITAYPREGLFVVRKLVGVLAKVIEDYKFVINEIPGDGILFSMDLGNFITLKKNDQDWLNNFFKELYQRYNDTKKEIIDELKSSCEYQSNENFYENFEDLVTNAYLKTAVCIDGIYFIPLDGISFKQTILYGTKLWNIPKAFVDFEDEKNKEDIILYHKNLECYFKSFDLNKNDVIIVKNIEENIQIGRYPKGELVKG